MSRIRTNAAAALLGVSPNTLRSWEQRFGHPTPTRTEGGHRIFELSEIEALRHAIAEAGDVASAISIVQQRGEGPSTPERLARAFADYDELEADSLLEQSLAVRSVERTVEAVLLEAVERLEAGSPEQSFAWRYATGWLAAAKRVAPPATREQGVLVFDGSRDEQLDSLHVQAFELLLRRLGLRALCLSASLPEEKIGNAVRALSPSAIVLAGAGVPLSSLGRLVHAVRMARPGIDVCEFRGALPQTGASTVTALGQRPIEATQALRSWLLESPRPSLLRVASGG
jgi:MerR family transcriptional regulator, light-induced transcriptional regulator